MDYSTEVDRRFRRGARAGTFGTIGGQIGHGVAGTMASGACIRIEINCDAGLITDTRFSAYGGPHLIAVCEWLTEWLIGQRARDVTALETRAIVEALDLPVEKTGCVLLAEDALRAALASLAQKE